MRQQVITCMAMEFLDLLLKHRQTTFDISLTATAV